MVNLVTYILMQCKKIKQKVSFEFKDQCVIM